MRAVNAVLTGVLMLSVTMGASTLVEAKSLRHSKGPAETPPTNFKGAQYIDSKGCAYIRAGYGGTVTWVPRVTRNRQVICGQTPTGVAGATRTAATQPHQTQANNSNPDQTVVASAPTPRAQRQNFDWNAFWFGKRTQRTPAPAHAQPAPQQVVVPPRAQMQVASVVQSAPKTHRGILIRTGPQAVHPADFANGRLGANGQTVQVARAQAVVPEGYQSLLKSEFQPAQRGVGSAQGQAQMDLIWTQTMPRKLIDVRTGQDVTAALPQVRYPYTTVSTRVYTPATPAYTPTKTRKKKRPLDEASPANMLKIEDVSALDPSIQSFATPEISVKAGKPASHRFVQVATFGVPANASRTIQKFSASGVPAVSKPLNRGGKTYAIVMLGPFADDAALKAALATARRAGFSDAFYVR